MQRGTRPDLLRDLAAVVDLLAHLRAQIISEVDHDHRRGDSPEAPSGVVQTTVRPTRLLLRVEEVAEMLAVSRSAVYALLRSGEIPRSRSGRST
jgi:excisionase family DNA binding protein